MNTYVSQNEGEFKNYFMNFFRKLKKGDVILLSGEVGTGKTTLVKYFGEFLNIDEIITSPTFSILKTYEQKLCHIDAYRINNEDLELEYYIDNGFITFIEWSENLGDYLPKSDYLINLDYTQNLEERKITIKEL